MPWDIDGIMEAGLLERIPLFASLPANELERLAHTLRRQHLDEGEFLLREGEKGHAMYILLEGQVEIVKTRARQTSAF